MSKPGNATGVIQQLRQEKLLGVINKRFRDEFYAFDLMKILYDDTIDYAQKVELLIILEEHGCLGITPESVDQIVTSLLDIFRQSLDKADGWSFACQALITATSLLVQLQQEDSPLSHELVKELVFIVTSGVNHRDSERLRSCACQCLIQLEDTKPLLLSDHASDFTDLCKQERTSVFQDYTQLAVTAVHNTVCGSDVRSKSPFPDVKELRKSQSYEMVDIRQMSAYIVENMPLLTRCGSFMTIQSVCAIVKASPQLSPIIFKPLLLHQMSTMSCVLLHAVLHLLHEFEGEILTAQEESDLMDRLCIMSDHPCMTPLFKLLVSQWARTVKMSPDGDATVHPNIVARYRFRFYPSVFDPVDVQLSKLYMTSLCGDTSHDTEGLETSILLGSLGCLHKLVWHTGSSRAAIALFKALYFMYCCHNNRSFSRDIQRFVRGLISEFAIFIPHSIDFMDSVHALRKDSQIYLEMLSLLHQQVVMATKEQICASYPFYLQIMQKAAMEKDIEQWTTLKFLQSLVSMATDIDDSSWRLGHSVLDICRNLLICQATDHYYLGLCDLLYTMMVSYRDTDVQDKARFYYCLITSISHQKLHAVLSEGLGDLDMMQKALTSLLPDRTKKRSLAKIIYLEDSVFKFERLSVTTRSSQREDMTESVSSLETDNIAVCEYHREIQQQEVKIEVTCRLTLLEFSKAHAVTLHVENSEGFHQVPDTHLACIIRPGYEDVSIQLQPILPLPLVINTGVAFACDNMQTYSVKLSPVSIEFHCLLMPLLWKPADNRKEFYEALWDWILRSTDNQRRGMESVKTYEITRSQFKDIHEEKLAKFEVLSSNREDICTWYYGMFLAPSNHLLLTCQQSQFHLTVTMAMDSWSLLPHVDRFLDSVLEQS